MKWNFFYSSFTALLITSTTSVFAQNTSNHFFEPLFTTPGKWFISFGAGQQYPQWNNPMKVGNDSGFPAPYSNDLYFTKNQGEPVVAVSLGKRWQQTNVWFPSYSLGIFWQYFFRTYFGNTVMQYSDPELANYRYQWDLTANLLLASAKINLVQYKILSPYFNIGIGSSFNRTANYKENALPGVIPRTSPGFSNFSNSEFAYKIGAGIDLQLSSNFIVSIGYNYQDLGQISSGAGKQIWSDQSLNPGSYHSNEILFSVSYLFGKQTGQEIK